MSDRPAIVGIFLVRNEEVFLAWAVRNVLEFCDRILIADNFSRDRTWEIAAELARRHPTIECHRVRRPGDSHALVQPYAGTRTWVFGVDGDEIYDPEGLRKFRHDLLSGMHDSWWVVFGNVLNCTALDRDRGEAVGYLAPPCRSMTKLFNFAAIDRWDGPCVERMLGGRPVFRPGYDASLRLNLHEQRSWDAASFRCLHTCFLPRSSRDRQGRARPNPVELESRGLLGRVGLGFLRRRPAGAPDSWKAAKYMRGEVVTKDISTFGPGPDGRPSSSAWTTSAS